MWSDLSILRRAKRLADFLHRDPPVVEDIIREAVEKIPQIVQRQRKRPPAETLVRDQPVLTRFEETAKVFFQLSLFETSEPREKTQELRAAPMLSLLLGRYIAHCVWQGLLLADSRHLALGLGCLVYRYTPRQVCEIFSLDMHHTDRMIHGMQNRLAQRFQHMTRSAPPTLTLRHATEQEALKLRRLVEHALTLCAPWGIACPGQGQVVLPPEWAQWPSEQHHHLCMHPDCAGIAGTVRAWNAQQSALPWNRREALLDDPDTTLGIPMFSTIHGGQDFDDTLPPEASDQELQELQARIRASRSSRQRRRRGPHFLDFRVCVDGHERGHFTPEARGTSLTVSSSALRLQIFGRDSEGELSLALFYLPDVLDQTMPQQLYAVLDGGATFEVVVTPVPEPNGTIMGGRVDLRFWAEEAQILKTPEWYEAAVTSAGLSVEVARFTGDQPAQAAWLARLGDLYQAQQQHTDALACWQASAELAHRLGDQALVVALRAALVQTSEPPAMGTWQIARQTLEQAVQRVRWLSSLWEPIWAGEPVTAQDTAAQEQAFYLDEGSLRLTCRWWAASPTQPATLLLVWTADVPDPGDLWVRFTQRDHPTVVLAEQPLGDARTGEAEWSADELGFDPSNEPWALTLMLMEPPA